MKGIRKCRKWLDAHPRFRKGLFLGILVLGVDVGAAACAGGESFSLAEEASVQSSTADIAAEEASVQSSTADIAAEEATMQDTTALLSKEAGKQDTAGMTANETSAGNRSDILPEEASIYVYVTGAVVNPGVYSLPEGARIYEAVAKAGGLREDAAAEYVNQASFLQDGEQIYFPTREEAETGACKLSEANSSGGMITAESLPQSAQGQEDDLSIPAQDSEQGSKININTADKTTLQKIPGVGEKKAEAILAYRNAHGAFGSIEEIKQVAGIKEASFQKMKDSITVE